MLLAENVKTGILLFLFRESCSHTRARFSLFNRNSFSRILYTGNLLGIPLPNPMPFHSSHYIRAVVLKRIMLKAINTANKNGITIYWLHRNCHNTSLYGRIILEFLPSNVCYSIILDKTGFLRRLDYSI